VYFLTLVLTFGFFIAIQKMCTEVEDQWMPRSNPELDGIENGGRWSRTGVGVKGDARYRISPIGKRRYSSCVGGFRILTQRFLSSPTHAPLIHLAAGDEPDLLMHCTENSKLSRQLRQEGPSNHMVTIIQWSIALSLDHYGVHYHTGIHNLPHLRCRP
jgi:hypothetical protein